jgi:hypothetical protein
MTEELTPEEMELLESITSNSSYPKGEEKQGVFTFFKKVIGMPDTVRTSNLDNDELGMPKLPIRSLKELSLFCQMNGLYGLASYFHDEGTILTNSALSKDGFLDRLVVTQRKLTEMKTKQFSEKQKKRWFGGGEDKTEENKEW